MASGSSADIYILGINESHNATACLMKNGVVVGCVSEERLCRQKNVYGFPQLSTEYLLRDAGITIGAVSKLVLSFENPVLLFHNAEYVADQISVAHLMPILKRIADEATYRFPPAQRLYDFLYWHVYKPLFWGGMRRKHEADIAAKTGIDAGRIARVNHHLCHAYSAYGSFPLDPNVQSIVVTLDGIGDDSCAAVMRPGPNGLEPIAATPNGHSPGMLYAYVTDYLGMKMGEHEYKVMGMSPYASPYEEEKAYERIKDLFSLSDELVFRCKLQDTHLGRHLKEALYRCRFDGIAGAVQRNMEELLCRYVNGAAVKTGARQVVCGGGVFMNVKANKLVLQRSDIDAAYFMPSAGDESTAIGAAHYGYEQLRREHGGGLPPAEPLRDLYLGVQYASGAVRQFIEENRLADRFHIYQVDDPERQIAQLLAQGRIVARVRGRMEWGARALGNRSILANPTDYAVVRVLNHQIKNRDFWMPFAGTVLAERSADYLLPLKRTDNANMMVAYDTTELARHDLKAAIHPCDFTMRAQVLAREYNPLYHALITEFQRLTGVGGILNTSLNLHGEPMVCSPADALHTLEDSGLEILAVEDFIIAKRSLA